jgi:hypothetical protein
MAQREAATSITPYRETMRIGDAHASMLRRNSCLLCSAIYSLPIAMMH